jgi:thymidylate synthase
MRFGSFPDAFDFLQDSLKHRGYKVSPATWQGVPTEGKPDLVTYEIRDQFFKVQVNTEHLNALAQEIGPNVAWADEHFLERVGGQPLNPPPSWKKWPYAHSAARFLEGAKFNHTYPERFWPKFAGMTPGGKLYDNTGDLFEKISPHTGCETESSHIGIRYEYGDLQDVINLLIKDPYTRQAYLPIFFPEDTGAVHGDRVPCTLGYHFMVRDGRLHVFYPIRSCDFVRHFRDDVYLAVRLLLHVLDCVRVERRTLYLAPGDLSMWIGSLHCFANDHREL